MNGTRARETVQKPGTPAKVCRVAASCRPLKELVFPLFDLVGVHVKLLGQFHQRLFAPNGGKCHLRLESRAMVPARSSCHGLFCSRHLSRSQAEIPLIPTVQISRATSVLHPEFHNSALRRKRCFSRLSRNVGAAGSAPIKANAFRIRPDCRCCPRFIDLPWSNDQAEGRSTAWRRLSAQSANRGQSFSGPYDTCRGMETRGRDIRLRRPAGMQFLSMGIKCCNFIRHPPLLIADNPLAKE
jgi:hypothetical protein